MKPRAAASPAIAALEHVDPRWVWHHCTLLRLRQKLRPDGAAADPAGGAEGPGRAESRHEVVLAELLPPGERLPEVEAALQRLRDGTYGICEHTAEPISPARLRAIPWTRRAHPANQR